MLQVVKQWMSTTGLVRKSVLHGHLLIELARTIYIRCIYSIFGRDITKYTVIYGVYIRFWPTLFINLLRTNII